jgi:hypothetical protein
MAAPDPKTPRKPPASELDLPYALGDKIPTGEAIEASGESVWALWSEISNQHEARFADTAPASSIHSMNSEDVGWAKTQPATSGASLPAAARRAEQALFTLDAAMLVARKNNRVCPRPGKWQEFHAMLPPRKTARGTMPAPAPIVGAAWVVTPPLTKRLTFREQIEWAESAGILEVAMRFMQSLQEDEWLHMGEE